MHPNIKFIALGMTLGVATIIMPILVSAQTPMPAASDAPNAPGTKPPPQKDKSGSPPTPTPVLPVLPTVAPGYVAPIGPLPDGDLVGVKAEPFVGIGLDDAISMGLQRNADLAISQSKQRVANYQIVAANGAYDVKFQLQPQYQHQSQAATNAFTSGPNGGPVVQDTAGATTGFSGELKSGQNYNATAYALYSNSNSIVNSFSPFYLTALAFNFTQPLGRGSGMNADRRTLELAVIGRETSRAQALLSASQIVTNVSNTYWNLVAAWRNAGIQEEGLREALAQAQSDTRRAARGAVAPVDIVDAQAQVSVFQDNVFSALGQVQKLQTQLKQLILSDPGDPVWTANLVPTSPVMNFPAEPTLQDLTIAALRNRPEVLELRAERDSANVNLAFAKDQLEPQIDLTLGYSTVGFAGFPTNSSQNPITGFLANETTAINTLLRLAGNPLPPLSTNFGTTPDFVVGGFGKSLKNTIDNRFPTYTIGLNLTIPLGDHMAKGQYQISLEQAKQVNIEELAVLERVRSEAVNALTQFRETRYRLVAATSARTASERVLAAEQRRFNVGKSTTFMVLQRQLQAANDRGRELQAQTDLNNAVVELSRVSGTVFSQYGIDATALGAKTEDAASPTQSALPPAESVTPK